MIQPAQKEQIQKLRKEYTDPEDLKFLDKMEKDLRKTILREGVYDLAVIKEIVKKVEQDIEGINFVLVHDEEIRDGARDILIAKKKVHEFYLERLTGKYDEKKIVSIENYLSTRIKTIGDTDS